MITNRSNSLSFSTPSRVPGYHTGYHPAFRSWAMSRLAGEAVVELSHCSNRRSALSVSVSHFTSSSCCFHQYRALHRINSQLFLFLVLCILDELDTHAALSLSSSQHTFCYSLTELLSSDCHARARENKKPHVSMWLWMQ